MENLHATSSTDSSRLISTIPVTSAHPFITIDDHTLFSVNAGVPVTLALEQVSTLLECIKSVVISRAITDPDTEAAAVQFLAEMAQGLVDAGHEGLCALEREGR